MAPPFSNLSFGLSQVVWPFPPFPPSLPSPSSFQIRWSKFMTYKQSPDRHPPPSFLLNVVFVASSMSLPVRVTVLFPIQHLPPLSKPGTRYTWRRIHLPGFLLILSKVKPHPMTLVETVLPVLASRFLFSNPVLIYTPGPFLSLDTLEPHSPPLCCVRFRLAAVNPPKSRGYSLPFAGRPPLAELEPPCRRFFSL